MNWVEITRRDVVAACDVRNVALAYVACVLVGLFAWGGGGFEWYPEPLDHRMMIRFVPSMGSTIH